jgi:radical SAM protein with 4Fe4S-binding SPASM domain
MLELKTVEIELTRRCNHNCCHCYARRKSYKDTELNTQQILRIIEDLTARNVADVCFTGGEPFIRNDFLSILRQAHGNGLHIWINTNGSFITGPMAGEIAKFRPLVVWLSLNGSTPEVHDAIHGAEGSFDKAVSAIKHLRDSGIPVFVSTTVMKWNLHDVKNISKLCNRMDVHTHSIDMCIGTTQAVQDHVVSADDYVAHVASLIDVKDLEYGDNELLRDRFRGRDSSETPCGAGFRKLAIDCEGNILPCIVLDAFIAGNVFRDSLMEVFRGSEVFLRFRKANIDGIAVCSSCRFRNVCRGGCRARAYFHNGELDSPDRVHCLFFRRRGHATFPSSLLAAGEGEA